jgi:HK97 family phage prohead protease
MSIEQRTKSTLVAPLEDIEVRTGEQTGDGQMTISGYAAVFNLLSEDLGGFREKLAFGAFTSVLSADPDVNMNWDHNTLYTLGRTRNRTLELTQLERGLRIFNRTAPTSYAADLGVLMERGDIDQMSFKFIPGEEVWTYPENDDDDIIVEVKTIDALYDVCVCAQGAYPQTESTAAMNRQRLEHAIETGRLPDRAADEAADRAKAARAREIAVASAGQRLSLARAN